MRALASHLPSIRKYTTPVPDPEVHYACPARRRRPHESATLRHMKADSDRSPVTSGRAARARAALVAACTLAAAASANAQVRVLVGPTPIPNAAARAAGD